MKHLKTILQVCKFTYHKLLSSPKFYALPLLALVLLLKKLLLTNSTADKIIRINLSDFINKLNTGVVSKVLVKPNKLLFIDKANSVYQTSHNLFPKTELFDRLMYTLYLFQQRKCRICRYFFHIQSSKIPLRRPNFCCYHFCLDLLFQWKLF